MNLYIETENGTFKNHPAYEDNLLDAFGIIPSTWEPFLRVDRPSPGVYQVLENLEPLYQKIDGVWTDVWNLRDMTAEEITAIQQSVITAFNAHPQASNWSTWTLDEATCEMVPPVARPEIDQTKLDAGIMTMWCGADNNWKDTPVRPEGDHTFDFDTWQWVEATPS
jgi:hypothetical protein